MPRLLLADDSVTIQRVIELTFADEAIEVVSVGDGRAAIEQIQQQPPDIVLADVGMPERDGYEVAAFIKGRPEFSSIPVLLLTGAFEPIDEGRARAVGCDGVLVKPFEPQMVISRVKDLLGGRRPDGMWAAPAPQSPLRQSAPVADAQLSVASPAAPAGGLEDYFDRLDAAFASLERGEMKLSSLPSTPQAEPAHEGTSDSDDLAHDLATWTMEQEAEPGPGLRPDPEPPRAEPMRQPEPAAPADGPRVASPRLAEAFAALLSAEQAQPFAPPAVAPAATAPVQPAPGPDPVPEHVVESIVERVVARMAEQAVRQTVLDVAERVVREEIDRIKAAHPQV